MEKSDLINISLGLDLWERITAIYFLIDGDDVVYVGKSIDLVSRILKHRSENRKKFTRYAYIRCDEIDLVDMEAAYIAKFAPKYNKQLSKNSEVASMEHLKSLFGCNAPKIKRYIRAMDIQSVNGYYLIRDFDNFRGN